ncbi:MAG: PDZ domain-containing protein [Gammaproteobacteria bacterium]|nr:PDZ domain-containing protein [Gammaproteobacteria bacterium]
MSSSGIGLPWSALGTVALTGLLLCLPSDSSAQEKDERECIEYENRSEVVDSTSGRVRMSARTPNPSSGFLGIATQRSSSREDNPDGYPRLIRVYCGYPAHEAGLRAGDLILAVNGRDARQPRVISAGRPGTVLEVRIQRDEEVLEFTVVSVRRPQTEDGESVGRRH